MWSAPPQVKRVERDRPVNFSRYNWGWILFQVKVRSWAALLLKSMSYASQERPKNFWCADWMMLRYANISTARWGKADRSTVEKMEKADSHRSKESMRTFLDLLWPGKEMGWDSPLTVRVRSSLTLDEAVEFSYNSDTKSTYSPLRMAFLVFSSMCAARSPKLEDGDDSSCCTELGSPKLMFSAIVEGAACPGMLEPVLARVAILLSTIVDTMEVI